MFIGSAPISAENLQFFKVTLGSFVIEGYGSTETFAVATAQLALDPTSGSVGTPLLCNKIKLGDIPDMDIIADRDHKGEVL